MKICINSRDLDPAQQSRIVRYFKDNFNFKGKGPELVWQEDNSDFILLGFPKGGKCGLDCRISAAAHREPRVMFRVHEKELLKIAGRFCNDIYHLTA